MAPPTPLRRSRPAALLLSAHPEPAAAVVVLATALAVADGRSPAGVASVAAAVAAGQLSVGWHNDWLDAERDRRSGRTDKPLADGLLDRRSVLAAALVAAAATVPLSLSSGWRAGTAHLVAVASAWAYNARLKATLLSWLPYAVSFALLVAFVTLGGRGSPWPAWWELAAAALLAVGAHLANAAPDVDDDLAAGLRGLPARLGTQASLRASAALLAAATGVLVVVGVRPAWLGAVIAVAAALAIAVGALIERRAGPRAAFRAVMVVALVDAVGLVVGSAR